MGDGRWVTGGTVYTGVTGNPAGRIWQHKTHADPKSFTARYKVERLVWYEVHETALSAIQREKRIKDWLRPWKDRLIEEKNPTWRDLSHELEANYTVPMRGEASLRRFAAQPNRSLCHSASVSF